MTIIPWAADVDLIHVLCRVGTLTSDGGDPDRDPDLAAVGGTVTITSRAPGGLLAYAEPDGRTRLVEVRRKIYQIQAPPEEGEPPVDHPGELVDASGGIGCWLLSPVSDRVKPSGYGYTAQIQITGGSTVTVAFDHTPTHPDGSIDLAKLVIEPVADGTTPTTVAQALANMQAQVDGVAADIGDAVADYLTANPPAAAPDATPTVTGIVRLAGDLGGTALAPTVPGLAGKAATGHTHTLDQTTDTATRLALTPAERVKLDATSGTNSGDQTLPTWTSLSGRPAVIAAGADAAAARAAIGAGTSSLVVGTGATDAKAGNYSPPAATATAQGIVELATTAETTTGTDTTRAVTPAGVKAVADTKANSAHSHTPAQIGTGTPAAGTYVDGATGAWTTLPAGGGGGGSVVGDVQFTVGGLSGSLTLAAQTFTTYPLDATPSVNLGGGTWTPANNTFTIPVAGLYLCLAGIRAGEGIESTSVATGIGTSNADAPYVLWGGMGAQPSGRSGRQYARLARFAQGDLVRLFIYSDIAFPTSANGAGQFLSLIRLAD